MDGFQEWDASVPLDTNAVVRGDYELKILELGFNVATAFDSNAQFFADYSARKGLRYEAKASGVGLLFVQER